MLRKGSATLFLKCLAPERSPTPELPFVKLAASSGSSVYSDIWIIAQCLSCDM